MRAGEPMRSVQNYEIEEEMFTVGPSTFFRARNALLGNPVSLRRLTLDPSRPEDARATFYREARLGAELWHPRIWRALDVLESDGCLWSVHEFNPMRATERLVREQGTLSVADASRMGAQLADALAHMHGKGRVHGKVSPFTVFVDREGDIQLVNLVKSADLAAGIWPLRPAVLGLGPFSAPEEFHNVRPTPVTDVYGLAATLFHWLTARFPRGGHTTEEGIERAAEAAPLLDVRALRPDTPSALADSLEAALQADPAKRHGSAASLGTRLVELQRLLAAEVPPGFESGTRLVLEDRPEVEIVGRHGAGAFGVVLKARSLTSGTLLAVKALKAEHRNDREALERFLREARALHGIAHPNVVRILGVGESRGTPYCVMQFIPGPDLATMLFRTGAFAPERAARIAAGIARGLEAIHTEGIIHRDLKPHNILLGEGERPVIADFGVARTEAATRLTGTGHLVGTLAYMAPEQLEDVPLTPAVDLYALGAILHEMLTGQVLFPGRDTVSTIRAIRENEAPPLPPEVPGELSGIVGRLLAKDASLRPARAREVAESLDSVVALLPSA